MPAAKAPEQVNNSGLSPELSQKLADYAKAGMKQRHAPGLAIGIVKSGQLVWSGYFGYADLQKKKPVGAETMFQIASVSKTFTAIGMMQQMEQGKFKITDPVNPLAPYPIFRPDKPGCREVEFLDVFTHRSGGGELMSYRQLLNIFPTTLVLPGQERPPLAESFSRWHPAANLSGDQMVLLQLLRGQHGAGAGEFERAEFQRLYGSAHPPAAWDELRAIFTRPIRSSKTRPPATPPRAACMFRCPQRATRPRPCAGCIRMWRTCRAI